MAMTRQVAFVLIAMAILFAGCANQRDSDPQAKEDKAAQQKAAKEIGSMDDLKCQSFGYQPGSTGYARCRKEFDAEREQ
jgi:PBP1b-binding outer membrane lipoprotein LpoB